MADFGENTGQAGHAHSPLAGREIRGSVGGVKLQLGLFRS